MKPFSPPHIVLCLLLMASHAHAHAHAKSDIDDLDAADRAEFQRHLNGSENCIAKGDLKCGRSELLAAKKFAISEKDRALLRKKEDDLAFTYERQARVDAKLKYEHERAAVDNIAEKSTQQTEEIRHRTLVENRRADAARSSEERAINNGNRRNAERWQAEENLSRQRSLAEIKRVLDKGNSAASTVVERPRKVQANTPVSLEAKSSTAQRNKGDISDRLAQLAMPGIANTLPPTERQNSNLPAAHGDQQGKAGTPVTEPNSYERFPGSQFWGNPTSPWLSAQVSLSTRTEACNVANERRAKSISDDERKGYVQANSLSTCICQTNFQPGGLPTEPGWLCAVYWKVKDTGQRRGATSSK